MSAAYLFAPPVNEFDRWLQQVDRIVKRRTGKDARQVMGCRFGVLGDIFVDGATPKAAAERAVNFRSLA